MKFRFLSPALVIAALCSISTAMAQQDAKAAAPKPVTDTKVDAAAANQQTQPVAATAKVQPEIMPVQPVSAKPLETAAPTATSIDNGAVSARVATEVPAAAPVQVSNDKGKTVTLPPAASTPTEAKPKAATAPKN